jgi:hypothetical protein
MPKERKLVREGEPSQKTEKGLEIPIVKTEDRERMLRKAATKGPGKRNKNQAAKEG